MQYDDRASLLDILESAKMILTYVTGKTWDDFRVDTQCQDAVVRRFEIIGEAVRRISEDFKTKYRIFPGER